MRVPRQGLQQIGDGRRQASRRREP
jgi:hypothetical protein